ncbi:ATP-binding cassette domain-containing protein [Paenibacillus chitinolyticus]|uniref:ATP-binding cassette domain-containing protein n=1 Tax=Paenibacillus chitinolyticus TaxID=79263 RepID=UPI003668BE74
MSHAIIKIRNLTKKFKGATVFEDISFQLNKGEAYGFLGYNGSGKSVLFKIICGFLRPDTGVVEIYDKILGKDIDYPENTGVIIETPGFLEDYSAYQNLKFLASIRNKITDKEIVEVLNTVELDPASKMHVKKFSLGMKQRLAIAQAVMENPEILVLDEPFNGLDSDGVNKIRELLQKLKEKGTTILLTSHIKEDIEILCNHVFQFNNKKLEQIY